MRCRRFLLAIPVLALGGCFWPGHGRHVPGQPYAGWKQVMRKVPPVYLVAIDRTQCTVTKEKYQKVKVGQVVFCYWGPPGSGVAGTGSDGWNSRGAGQPGVEPPSAAPGTGGTAAGAVGVPVPRGAHPASPTRGRRASGRAHP